MAGPRRLGWYALLNLCLIAMAALPKNDHAPMMGLIVVFSALGGTTGSFVTGQVFGAFHGAVAYCLPLVPMMLLALSPFKFRRSVPSPESDFVH